MNEDDNCLIRDYAFRDAKGKIEKGIKELNDLERLCYLFIKNEYTDIIKDNKEDIIKMMIKMYDKFRNNEPMWSLANQLALARIRTESFKDEYHSKGLEEGIEIGREKEKARCIVMIKKQEYIFEEDIFETFKQRIEANK